MSCRKVVYPFTAIVGQEKMKKALILNAINPLIGGVLISGQKGTAKSTAVRALANILPEIEVVADCEFKCNPYNKNEMCNNCLHRIESGEKLPVIKQKIKIIDLPLGATEDRVVGTLNIEQAIKKGERKFEPGILAEVHRGILYVDEINLLDDHLVDILLDSAAMGFNYVEREGISFSHPARFILVGTMNPEEGELRPQLLDRFGLFVEVEGIFDPELRTEIVRRCLEYENEPHIFENKWQNEEIKLKKIIENAKLKLSSVEYDNKILELITNIAIEMKVDGHRADIIMLKVAKTLAAYYQRNNVCLEDVLEAAELVLSHRIKKKPLQDQTIDKEKLKKIIEDKKKLINQNEIKNDNANNNKTISHNQAKIDNDLIGNKETKFEIGEKVKLKSIKYFDEKEEKKSGGRRSFAISDNNSGKYIKSVIPQKVTGDIAIDATIRAAAPFQILRHKNIGIQELDNINLTTLEKHNNFNQLIIEVSDIREKIRGKKVRNFLVLLIDSSGSMAAKNEMSKIKGLIFSFLIDAYQKRDKISMIAFKGKAAEVLLYPTINVEFAKKQLEELSTGGKTPLNEGILKGLELIKKEIKKDKKIQPILIIISDGKINSSAKDIKEEYELLLKLAEEIKYLKIKTIVIDTENSFIKLGKLQEFSEKSGAKYWRLN
ncbi:MAG TPA: magnesium chelatase subunit D family protein [bacterium]|nr:magnesium chelatase subunit D family protein [bacterium]HOL48179.1 magnesium chelatase subunit D family protein [bacterium]HPQ19387.1 magnesium chelatase subunit D family protein [bacterium]